MHGDDPSQETSCASRTCNDSAEPIVGWSANSDGSITCPPFEIGGCGGGCLLELKRMLPDKWISNLEAEARNILERFPPHLKKHRSEDDKFMTGMEVADREDSDDNIIYCPHSSQLQGGRGLDHFKEHWVRGEPVVVRDVLRKQDGLSWEPMVMWRALCDNVDSTVSSKMSEVKAIDCLSNCEVWSKNSYLFHIGSEHIMSTTYNVFLIINAGGD